jgi:hypothetical protein
MQEVATKTGNYAVMRYHSLIRQEKICSTSLTPESIITVFVTVANFILSRGERTRNFKICCIACRQVMFFVLKSDA